MIGCAPRWLLATIVTLVAAMGCSATTTPPVPTSAPATASTSGIDYVALEAEIEKAITTGPATLDNVRAVLISVDGESKITHYRHDFTQDDYGHVFSVTKSVLSILIGIAIDDGLIDDVDEPLMKLLPMHRKAMSGDTGQGHIAPSHDHVGWFQRRLAGRVCLGGVRQTRQELHRRAA